MKLTENEMPANHTGSAVSGTVGLSDPTTPKSPILGLKRRSPLTDKIINNHRIRDNKKHANNRP